MYLIKQYLNESINKIRNEINKLHNNDIYLLNNLVKKKIEYISFYLDNSLNELEELNELLNNDLLDNKEYISNELENYTNMENVINQALIQTL
tara:strand:- start:318 stop:596 length:279 start_codon:yes stop_codon:yes gene_type:complete